MALKRAFPLKPDERLTPDSPNEAGNDIPRESPLPAAAYDDLVVSSVFEVEVYLEIQSQVIDFGGTICDPGPIGCKPEVEMTKVDAPTVAMIQDSIPIVAMEKDSAPIVTMICRKY